MKSKGHEPLSPWAAWAVQQPRGLHLRCPFSEMGRISLGVTNDSFNLFIVGSFRVDWQMRSFYVGNMVEASRPCGSLRETFQAGDTRFTRSDMPSKPRKCGRWPRVEECWLFLRRTQVWLPAPIRGLAAVCNSSSRESSALFRPPWVLHTRGSQYGCRQNTHTPKLKMALWKKNIAKLQGLKTAVKRIIKEKIRQPKTCSEV